MTFASRLLMVFVAQRRQDTAAARIRSVIAANVRHPRRLLKETKVRQWRPATHQDADVLVMSSKLLEAIWLITKRWGQKCMLHTSAVYEPRRWNCTLLLLMGQLCRISLEGNDAKMSQTNSMTSGLSGGRAVPGALHILDR